MSNLEVYFITYMFICLGDKQNDYHMISCNWDLMLALHIWGGGGGGYNRSRLFTIPWK